MPRPRPIHHKALGFVDPVTLGLITSHAGELLGVLGISPSRLRTPQQNLAIRKQQVDATYAQAMNRDQLAVAQLWLWSGIANNNQSGMPTDDAKRYVVSKLSQYYNTSGAALLPHEWMQKLSQPNPWQTPLPDLAPVPSQFEGRGVTIPGTHVTIPGTQALAGMNLGTVAALGLGAAIIWGITHHQPPARRARRRR